MRGTLQEWEDDRAKREILNDIGSLADVPEFEPKRSVPLPPTTDTLKPAPCELMRRGLAGIYVSLEWHPATGPTITLYEGEDTPYCFTIPPEKALDAFHHPYVYDPR